MLWRHGVVVFWIPLEAIIGQEDSWHGTGNLATWHRMASFFTYPQHQFFSTLIFFFVHILRFARLGDGGFLEMHMDDLSAPLHPSFTRRCAASLYYYYT